MDNNSAAEFFLQKTSRSFGNWTCPPKADGSKYSIRKGQDVCPVCGIGNRYGLWWSFWWWLLKRRIILWILIWTLMFHIIIVLEKSLLMKNCRNCRKSLADPHLIYGKDAIYTFFHLMGMQIDYDEIF